MPTKPWLGGIKSFIIRNRAEIIAAAGIIVVIVALGIAAAGGVITLVERAVNHG